MQALLCAPEPDDPQDAVVASQYKNQKAEYERTARQWTQEFAKDIEEVHQEQIQRLMEMGFEEEIVRKALEAAGWDENSVINSLLGQ